MSLPLPEGAVPQFSRDAIPLDLDESLGGNAWAFFRKTQLTKAIRIDRPFAVMTIHGGEPQTGEAGDWLAVDAMGHPYPIAASVFSESFAPADPAPDTPPEAWQGEEPAEGTRRSVIRDALVGGIVGRHLSAPALLQVADEIEIALQSAADQPVMEEGLAELDLNAVAARLQSLSDLERGQLMEKVGGAAGIVGSLVRQAAEQLEGFPAEVKVPALLLLAAGIADQAGPTA